MVYPFFLKTFIWCCIITNAIMNARKSDADWAAHTPVTPHRCGSTISSGMRNITWRVRDSSIAFPAMPMLWKKLDVTIW